MPFLIKYLEISECQFAASAGLQFWRLRVWGRAGGDEAGDGKPGQHNELVVSAEKHRWLAWRKNNGSLIARRAISEIVSLPSYVRNQVLPPGIGYQR